MSARTHHRPAGGRRPAVIRWLIAAGVCACGALVLLVADQFLPTPWVPVAALWSLGASFLSGWAAVLAWRMPVLGRRGLFVVTAAWSAGVGLSIGWSEWGVHTDSGPATQWAAWWLAVGCSLLVGALFLRALLRRRASSLVGRLLSLITPIAILSWIVFSATHR